MSIPTQLTLEGRDLFLEETAPYADPFFDMDAPKRVCIAVLPLMPEIADEFESGLSNSASTSKDPKRRARTRGERLRTRLGQLERMLNGVDAGPRSAWVSASLAANCRVMYHQTIVFNDRIKERGFERVPLHWQLIPSAKAPGLVGSKAEVLVVDGRVTSLVVENLKPFRNYFLSVSACFYHKPVYEEGDEDDFGGGTQQGDFTPALLHAENELTYLIWHALGRR